MIKNNTVLMTGYMKWGVRDLKSELKKKEQMKKHYESERKIWGRWHKGEYDSYLYVKKEIKQIKEALKYKEK